MVYQGKELSHNLGSGSYTKLVVDSSLGKLLRSLEMDDSDSLANWWPIVLPFGFAGESMTGTLGCKVWRSGYCTDGTLGEQRLLGFGGGSTNLYNYVAIGSD